MPKYLVTLKETVIYTVEVEANDAEHASEIACEIWAESPDPDGDFCGEGQGVEAIEIIEVRK
jgi:hypothetical protein